MPDPTATQQAAIEASEHWVGTKDRNANRRFDLPKGKREAGIEFVRRDYVDRKIWH